MSMLSPDDSRLREQLPDVGVCHWLRHTSPESAGPRVSAVMIGNARLYNFKPKQRAALADDRLADYKELDATHGGERTNLAYRFALKPA